MKDIAIYGAGGFGREIACLIQLINQQQSDPQWNIIGFFDDDVSLKGLNNDYGIVLGGINELNSIEKPLSIALAIGNPSALKQIVEKINNPNVDFPNIIAPSTLFLDKERVRMGKGNIVCSRCTLSCNVELGDFNLLNGYITVGHDTIMGSYNVVMPSVNISGGVEMEDCNFLGVQSVVLQYIKIGCDIKLGANSVLMRRPKDGFLYLGNPATKVQL